MGFVLLNAISCFLIFDLKSQLFCIVLFGGFSSPFDSFAFSLFLDNFERNFRVCFGNFDKFTLIDFNYAT